MDENSEDLLYDLDELEELVNSLKNSPNVDWCDSYYEPNPNGPDSYRAVIGDSFKCTEYRNGWGMVPDEIQTTIEYGKRTSPANMARILKHIKYLRKQLVEAKFDKELEGILNGKD